MSVHPLSPGRICCLLAQQDPQNDLFREPAGPGEVSSMKRRAPSTHLAEESQEQKPGCPGQRRWPACISSPPEQLATSPEGTGDAEGSGLCLTSLGPPTVSDGDSHMQSGTRQQQG